MLLSYMAIPGIPKKKSEILLNIDQQIKLITSAVCCYYGVTSDGLNSKKRDRILCDARHVTIYFLCEILSMGTSAIGKKILRDHSTVMSGKNKIKDLMSSDRVFRMQIHLLRNQIEKYFMAYKNILVESKNKLNENTLQLS